MISARKVGVLALGVMLLTMVVTPVNAWGGGLLGGFGLGDGLGAGIADALSAKMPGLASMLSGGANSQDKTTANAPSK
jgi:outer membrane lipoprotein SlyB